MIFYSAKLRILKRYVFFTGLAYPDCFESIESNSFVFAWKATSRNRRI